MADKSNQDESTPTAPKVPVESKSVVVEVSEPISFDMGKTPETPAPAPVVEEQAPVAEESHPDFPSDAEIAKRRLQILL